MKRTASGDDIVHCIVSAANVAADPEWLEKMIAEGRLVKRRPNGDVVLRFKASELRKLPS